MDFDRYTVLLLVRRTDAPALDAATAARLQDAHMTFLADQHAEGRLLAAGPVDPPSPTNTVGVCLYRVGVEEARSIGEGDPLVQAGRLRTEVFSWNVPAGTVSFAPTRFPRSMAEVGPL